MDISIILLNYKQRGLVKQCIKGIYASNIKLDFEIILVDNNSRDGCVGSIKSSFSHVVTIQNNKNFGFGGGNNIGIKKAQGKYILILNPDIVVTERVIEKMHEFMEKNPDIGILGPKLLNPDRTLQDSCRRFPKWITPILRRTLFGHFKKAEKVLGDYLMADFKHDKNIPVDWLFGAFLFIRKSDLETIGLFDERFFIYFEDLDLCRRFWEKKREVWYYADASFIHYHYKLSAENMGIFSIIYKSSRQHIISGLKYYWKYLKIPYPR